MSQEINPDKLEVIIGYLKQQGIALETLDRRMDSLSTDLKIACDSMRSVVERQASMERNCNNRLANCSDIMNAMSKRIVALEHMLTPIPHPFDSSSIDDTPEVVIPHGTGGNGFNEKDAMQTQEELYESCECYENDTNKRDEK